MKLGKAALVVSAGILASRLLGLVRNAAISGLLGDSAEADIYFDAFFVPDLLFYLVAGGFLSITFIPILSRYLAEDREEEGWRAFSSVATPVLGLLVGLTVLGWMFTDALVDLVFVRFRDLLGGNRAALSGTELAAIADLTRIVLPSQIFFLLGSLLMGVQYTKGHFVIPAIAPVIYNTSIILGGLVGAAVAGPSPEWFAWGALGGAAVGNFGLQWWGARRVGLRLRRPSLRHEAVPEYARLALPLMIGQSIAVLDEQFFRVFGQWAGEGGTTQLVLARQTNMVPVGLIGQAASVAAFPALARLVAEGRSGEMRATLSTALRYVVFIGVAATAVVFATSKPAIRVLYQRGEFGPDATAATASVLVVLAIGIALWGTHQLYSRAFYAEQKMWPPVLLGTAATVLYLFAIGPLFDSYGLAGIAAASVVGVAAYATALIVAWHRNHGWAELGPVGATLARSVAAAAPAGLAGWWVTESIAGPVESLSFGRGLAAVALGALVVLAAYLAIARALRTQEADELLSRIRTVRA